MSEILTVSQVNCEINHALKRQNTLQNCWVIGEISNFKNHVPSGHWYFTLKDEAAGIRSVMFRSRAAAVGFRPENGMKVIIRGSVRLYEKDGNVQIYVMEMYPSGLGTLYLALEQLKSKLAAEGLFSQERKKSIPKYPLRIGIVTSPTGAALRDIVNIARRRNPYISLILVPSAVQGEAAPREIVQAIEKINRCHNIDLLIVGRGGGSLEELWAFNTEEVARAIAASRIPVISAVGHEVDYTIADFVADLRAPTPSAAAELAIPVLTELQLDLKQYEEKLKLLMTNHIMAKRRKVEELKANPSVARPMWRIDQLRQSLDSVFLRLQEGITGFVTEKSGILKLLSAKLDLLSPLAVLGRGYSLAYDQTGKLIKSVDQVNKDQDIYLKLSDGCLDCWVKKVKKSISK